MFVGMIKSKPIYIHVLHRIQSSPNTFSISISILNYIVIYYINFQLVLSEDGREKR